MNNLTATADGIHLALTFNNNVPIVGNSKPAEAGRIDYVWGADYGGANPKNIPGGSAWHEDYIPWGMDAGGGTGHPTSWFITNHPDWLMYQSDQQTVAYLDSQHRMGNYGPALDYANPSVRQYVIDSFVTVARNNGFQGISFDEGTLENFFAAAGHYSANGSWIQQYSGAADDTAWKSAQADALQKMVATIKALYPSMTVTVNQPLDCGHTTSDWNRSVASADQVFDESGFTVYGDAGRNYATNAKSGYCGNFWLTKMQQLEYIQTSLGKGLVLNNLEPYTASPYMTDTNAQARFDLQWALANYLLIKYDHTYFWWGDASQYGSGPIGQHEYSAKVGSPTDDFYGSQNVYMRDYSSGLVLVNPSNDSSYTITLPAGRYADLYGNPVDSYTMAPHSGLILLSAGPASTSTPTSTPMSTVTATSTVGSTSTPTPTSTPIPQATVTSTPRATATSNPAPNPTSTPRTAPTSTPTASGRELISNGGFEQTLFPWQNYSPGRQPLTSSYSHSGSYSASLCGYSGCHDQLWQGVTIPFGISRVTLSYWVYAKVQGNYATFCGDYIQTSLTVPGQGVAFVGMAVQCAGVVSHGWTYVSRDVTFLLRPYQRRQISLDIAGSTRGSTQFFVDDVSLYAS